MRKLGLGEQLLGSLREQGASYLSRHLPCALEYLLATLRIVFERTSKLNTGFRECDRHA